MTVPAELRESLEAMDREALVAEARNRGAPRPEVMTRVELVDEVLRLSTPNPVERKKLRGWLGIARDLIASVVEQGLNLPDAASLIRGDVRFEPLRPVQAPVATVTLAGIYGAQGHLDRAIGMLDEVLAKEPDHRIAKDLHGKLARQRKQKNRVPGPVISDKDAADADLDDDALDRAETLRPPGGPLTGEDPSDYAETLWPRARVDHGDASLPESEPDADAADAPTLPPKTNGSPRSQNGSGDYAAVFARVAPTKAVVYFEAPATNGEATALAVLAVEWRPQPGGAARVAHEISVSGERGTAVFDAFAPGSEVRVALGARRSGVFVPLAVAAELRASPGNCEVVWSPRPRAPDPDLAARAAESIAALG